MAKPELTDGELLEALERYPHSACEAHDHLKLHTVYLQSDLCIDCHKRVTRVEDEANPFEWELHSGAMKKDEDLMAGRDTIRVEIEVEGEPVVGYYVVERGMIKVSAALWCSKETQLGSSPPEALARMMLRELVADSKRNR